MKMKFFNAIISVFKTKDTTDMTKKQKLIAESRSIFFIIVAVLTFRSVFFEPFRIPSGSMIPTLMIGDFILVNKFAYGLKIPFSDVTLSFPEFLGINDKNFNPVYIAGKSDPKRGDVVVFKYPKDVSVNYIKRVVGLPGDMLEMRNKIIYINDKAISPAEYDGKAIMADMDDKFKGYNLKFFKLQTGEHEHIIQQNADDYFRVDFDKITIPPGKFFMMGDNRDFSYDSRFWGFVSHEQIKGRAMFVWFSLIFPFSDSPVKFRPGRIGTMIK